MRVCQGTNNKVPSLSCPILCLSNQVTSEHERLDSSLLNGTGPFEAIRILVKTIATKFNSIYPSIKPFIYNPRKSISSNESLDPSQFESIVASSILLGPVAVHCECERSSEFPVNFRTNQCLDISNNKQCIQRGT